MALSNKPPAASVLTSVNGDAAASTANHSPVSSGALTNGERDGETQGMKTFGRVDKILFY